MRKQTFLDIKDFVMIAIGFILFVTPMIAIMVEGVRCAYLK